MDTGDLIKTETSEPNYYIAIEFNGGSSDGLLDRYDTPEGAWIREGDIYWFWRKP